MNEIIDEWKEEHGLIIKGDGRLRNSEGKPICQFMVLRNGDVDISMPALKVCGEPTGVDDGWLLVSGERWHDTGRGDGELTMVEGERIALKPYGDRLEVDGP